MINDFHDAMYIAQIIFQISLLIYLFSYSFSIVYQTLYKKKIAFRNIASVYPIVLLFFLGMLSDILKNPSPNLISVFSLLLPVGGSIILYFKLRYVYMMCGVNKDTAIKAIKCSLEKMNVNFTNYFNKEILLDDINNSIRVYKYFDGGIEITLEKGKDLSIFMDVMKHTKADLQNSNNKIQHGLYIHFSTLAMIIIVGYFIYSYPIYVSILTRLLRF
jgi:hypothetical protein